MPKPKKIEIAQREIDSYFESLHENIFKATDIFRYLRINRHAWDLAKSTSPNEFINYLIKNSKLKKLDFPFPYRHETRFTWGEVPLLEVLLTLHKNSYFTHYTAMLLHGLVKGDLHEIYLNHEQVSKPQSTFLEQKNIDTAFRNSQRNSKNHIKFNGTNICAINGMNTNQLGVVTKTINLDSGVAATIRITNIERTLIDITVRPAYSGGIENVKAAYIAAKDRVSVNSLKEMLGKLRYVYPYHQAIGYYLENAGYASDEVDIFRDIPKEFDFYLSHKIEDANYIKEWRIYVPQN